MAYRYETTRTDYGDLASGAVLRSAPGFPAFPVRLASEVFQRALALRGGPEPATVWDPCCGSGYLLTVLGLVHRRRISALLASDIDDEALRIARANLELLTPSGLADRAAELAAKADEFGKPSYDEAAAAAGRLGERLTADGGPLRHAARKADVFDRAELAAAVDGYAPDLVITDLPYGEQTDWQGSHADAGLPGMLAPLGAVLPPTAIVAVIVRGRRVPPVAGIRPRQSLRIGTRAAALFAAGDLAGPALN